MSKLYGGTIDYRGKDKQGKGKYWLDMPCGKDPITGKYRRKREMFHGTKKQAERRLNEMRFELESNMAVDADKRRFPEYCNEYLTNRENGETQRPATYKVDRTCEKHLVKWLGDIRLVDITPSTVDALYGSMHQAGVGETTVLQCHKLLRRVLQYAVLNNVIPSNPCALVKPPKRPTPQRESLSHEEAARLAGAASSEPITAMKIGVYIALSTGCRLGECLGLEWQHIHLDGERPFIFFVQQYTQQCKLAPLKTDENDNPKGRVYPIDQSTVDLLKAWKAHQAKLLEELGGQNEKTAVVSNETGGHKDPARYGQWFRSFCVEYGFGKYVADDGKEIIELAVGDNVPASDEVIVQWRDADGWPCDELGKRYSRSYPRPKINKHYKGLRFHELRHTHYTLRLANGMDLPTAMALGGWQDERVLLKTYAHPVSENVWASVGFMDDLKTS